MMRDCSLTHRFLHPCLYILFMFSRLSKWHQTLQSLNLNYAWVNAVIHFGHVTTPIWHLFIWWLTEYILLFNVILGNKYTHIWYYYFYEFDKIEKMKNKNRDNQSYLSSLGCEKNICFLFSFLFLNLKFP